MKLAVAIFLVLQLSLAANALRIPLYKVNQGVQLTTGQNGNLVDLAKSLGLTTLVSLAEHVNIANVLEDAKSLTLFGPTNQGFANVPEPIRPLLSNETILRFFLLFHVLKGQVYSGAIENELLVPTIVETEPKFYIRFNVYDRERQRKIVTAQCSRILQVDRNASNGVIHVLDRVMIPANDTIAGIVTTYSQYYSILLLALEKAGLDVVLKGKGPFTVFAPTNEAFSKIPSQQLQKILADIPLLKKILEYHVVDGTQCSVSLYNGQQIPTLEKSDLNVAISGGDVHINKAKVVYADGTALNGVIHTIDTVLIPSSVEV